MTSVEPAQTVRTDDPLTAQGDRRSWERVALEVEVTLTSDSQFFAGLSGDVSEGGIFVQTYRSYAVGSRVLLAFSLPTGEIRTEGVICWVRPSAEGTLPGVGIGFENLPAAERRSIEAFCKARPPLYHDLDGQ